MQENKMNNLDYLFIAIMFLILVFGMDYRFDKLENKFIHCEVTMELSGMNSNTSTGETGGACDTGRVEAGLNNERGIIFGE
jgi:hypothetical protein